MHIAEAEDDVRSAVVVNLQCSPAVPCPDMLFKNIDIAPPSGQEASYVCKNVINEEGLPGACV